MNDYRLAVQRLALQVYRPAAWMLAARDVEKFGGGGGTGSVPVTELGLGVGITTVDVLCAFAGLMPKQASAKAATKPRARVRGKLFITMGSP